MNASGSPTPCFYYVPAKYAISCIELLRIKVATIDKLNDPFDLRPVFIPKHSDASTFAKELTRDWRKMFAQKYGMVCMSSKLNDPVLWAHYADRHAGMVIEFIDFSEEEFVRVLYKDAPVPIPVEGIDSSAFEALFEKVITTKFTSWGYEEEVRCFVDLDECVLDGEFYFRKISANVIKHIFLGVRCSIDSGFLYRLLRQNSMPDVRVSRGRESSDKFTIEFDECAPD